MIDGSVEDVSILRGIWLMTLGYTANLIGPEIFFLSQFISLFLNETTTTFEGLELIYIEDKVEFVLYFLIAALVLPLMQFESFFFVFTFWYVYAAAILVELSGGYYSLCSS